MSKKGRGSRKKTRPKRRTSGLGDHQRHKKTLTPPLLGLPNVQLTSWPHTGLPECLWLGVVVHSARESTAPYVPLDVLDELREPDAEGVLDGRITSFALIPSERRAEAREALRERAPLGLPDDFGHAISLYPECPAFWLYEDWLEANEVDRDRAIAYLKDVVGPMLPSREPLSAQLRMLAIGRTMKAGKLRFNKDLEVLDLLPKYPALLNLEDRQHVESFSRNTWNMLVGMADENESLETWCRYFWQRNWEISDCDPEPGKPPLAEDEGEPAADIPAEESGSGSIAADEEPSLNEVRRGFVDVVGALGEGLRRLQSDAVLDMFDPESDEVKLGLASRAFRLLDRFVRNPQLWTNELAPHILRSMVDERIVVAWLIKQDDSDLFRTYKEYGQGKQKLFKLKLEELMDRDDLGGEDLGDLHKQLEAEVNQDSMEEFLEIDLGGSFSAKNIRQMAQEADLADLYSLTYQPLSSEAHGEWGSLIRFDLRHCGNPLHRFHRLGRFDASGGGYIYIGWVRNALALVEDTVAELYGSIGLDTGPLFDACHETMNEVVAGRT